MDVKSHYSSVGLAEKGTHPSWVRAWFCAKGSIRIAVAFLLLCCSLLTGAFQNSLLAQSPIDSLKKAIVGHNSASAKIDAWNSLYRDALNTDYALARELNEALLAEGLRTKSDSILFNAYLYDAYVLRLTGDLNSALEITAKASGAVKRLKSPEYSSKYHTLLGTIYIFLDQPDSAYVHMNHNIKHAIDANDYGLIADAYFSLAHFFGRFGDYNQSLRYCLMADSTYQKNDEPDANHASVISNIGTIFLDFKEFNKALEYFTRAEEMYQEAQNVYGIHMIQYRFAELYYQLGEYTKSLRYLDEALPFFEDNNIKFRLIDIFTLAGNNHIYELNFDKAQENHRRAVELSLMIGDTSKIASSSHALARSKALAGDIDNALVELKYALEMSNKSHLIKESAEISKSLSEMFEIKNDFANALSHYKIYLELRDSVQRSEQRNTVMLLETKYQTKNKEQAIELLTIQNEVSQQKAKSQRTIYFGSLALGIVLLLSLLYSNNRKIKTAQKIRELDETKTRFFNNISHEFRTPLTLIKSPLEKLKTIDISPERQKMLDLIEKNSNRLMELVDQLLMLSKLESKEVRFVFTQTQSYQFFESALEPYLYQAKSNDITFQIDPIPNEQIWIDHDAVHKIISNLLGNALKYTPAKHLGKVSIDVRDGFLNMVISNTGVHLQNIESEKLFERFYQKDNQSVGVGIGLALTKELVQNLNGTIAAEISGDQLTFRARIPVSKELVAGIPGVIIESDVFNTEEQEPDLIDNENEKPIVLLVEDNPSVREVVRSLFEDCFQVLEAKDGKEGLNKAVSMVPDVIITDAMMPVMDGFALTRELKANPLTSFIPIVMLTAKAEDADHLQALETMVDAYMTKPFSNQILIKKVEQLIETRTQWQKQHSKQVVISAAELEVPDLDKDFLEKAQSILDSELANPEFSAAEFATQVGVSRMQLHRKLKTLAGMSTLDYIKNFRLHSARKLLQNSNLYVSEVAYMVGFNDAKYFSQCYKKLFGVTPSDKQQ